MGRINFLEKPNPLTRKELAEIDRDNKKSRRTKIRKNIMQSWTLDDMIKEYSKKLGRSESSILEELANMGIAEFEKTHRLKILEAVTIEKREQTVKDLSNEILAKALDEKRKNVSSKANQLREAYLRRMMIDYNSRNYDYQNV